MELSGFAAPAAECPSCYEPCDEPPVLLHAMVEGESVPPGACVRLPCAHVLHEACLYRAFRCASQSMGGVIRECPLCRTPFPPVPRSAQVPFLKGYHRPKPKPPPRKHVAIQEGEWVNGSMPPGTLVKVCTARTPPFPFGTVVALRGRTQVTLANEDAAGAVQQAHFSRKSLRRVIVET